MYNMFIWLPKYSKFSLSLAQLSPSLLLVTLICLYIFRTNLLVLQGKHWTIKKQGRNRGTPCISSFWFTLHGLVCKVAKSYATPSLTRTLLQHYQSNATANAKINFSASFSLSILFFLCIVASIIKSVSERVRKNNCA